MNTERRILLIHHTAIGGTEKATNSGTPVDGVHYQTGQEIKNELPQQKERSHSDVERRDGSANCTTDRKLARQANLQQF